MKGVGVMYKGVSHRDVSNENRIDFKWEEMTIGSKLKRIEGWD